MSRMVRGSDLVNSTPNVTGEIWPTVDDLADYILANGQFGLDIPGTVPRSVGDALADTVSVKWFGAKGDGITDDRNAIQAGIDYLASIGGGRLYFPRGTYYKRATSAAITPKSNITLCGEGMGATVLKHDDTTGTNRYIGSVSIANACENFAIQDLTFEGMWSTGLNSNGLQIAELWYIDGLRIENVESRLSRSMGLTGRHCNNVLITGCYIHQTNGDGLAFWDCADVRVIGNRLEDCDDDCISLHTNDTTAAPLRNGVVVSNNNIVSSQGIKVLGAKNAVISGNTLRRVYAYGIYVDSDTSFNQGNTPNHSIVIEGNVINDVFRRAQGGNAEQYYMRIGGGQKNAGAGAAPPGENNTGTGTIVDLFGTNLGNFQSQNTDDTSVASPGGYFWTVRGNILTRTLPAVAAYTDWGFGPLFSGNQGSGSYTGAIAETDLNTNGIIIDGPIRYGLIEGNTIRTTGARAVFFNVGATPAAKLFRDFIVRGNLISDFKEYGIFWPASTLSAQDVTVEGNQFDGDPRFVNANRGANGTFLANTFPIGVYLAFGSGFHVTRNEFRNVGRMVVQGGTAVNNLEGNVAKCDPAAIGFNVANKGIGETVRSGWQFRYIIEDSDPASATFGQIANATLLDSNTIPTTGKYVAGHITRNVNPSVAGGAGSQYIVWGWMRTSLGTGHVLNTDWREMRTLTGT